MIPSTLIEITVNHALQIAGLAATVWLMTRLFAKERPHLAHALWALVLLKCLVPPILPSPTSPFSWFASTAYQPQSANSAPIESPLPHNQSNYEVVYLAQKSVSNSASRSGAPAKPAQFSQSENEPGSLGAILCVAWIVSIIGCATWTAVRIGKFALLVHSRSLKVPPHIAQAASDLQHKLGIRRTVRVRVLDALVGPAVMGILRPTLLLPKVIAQKSTPDQLRALLAHELIHIRRGDLLWSALQAAVSVLWWFHPAVWIANRLLTRESERSCDEETIASLGIKPAEYARSLLSVIETKQQLAAAPIVPGLRPVDITSNRMERIMRIGQGSHSRTPVIAFVTLFTGALIALPGAALLTAQEEGKERPRPPLETQPTVAPAPATPAPPLRPRLRNDAPATQSDNVYSIDITTLEVPTILIGELGLSDATRRATTTTSYDKQTAGDLDVRFAGGVESDLGVPGQLVIEFTNSVVSASSLKFQGNEQGPIILDAHAVALVQQWRKGEDKSEARVLSRPRIILETGKRGTIKTGTEIPYVSDVDKKTSQPEVSTLETGFSCDIEIGKLDSKQMIALECTVTNTNLVSLDANIVTTGDGSETATIHSPFVKSHSVNFGVTIPIGSTVACCSGKSQQDGVDYTTLFVACVETIDSSPSTSDPARKQTMKTTSGNDEKSPDGKSDKASSQNDRVGNEEAEPNTASKPLVEKPLVEKQAVELVSIIGPITAGKPARLPPPSDRQIMQAIDGHLKNLEDPAFVRRAEHRIVKRLISEKTDPPRFVPLIGNTQLHHAHYKCAVYSKLGDEAVANVVYIDHNHFVMSGEAAAEVPSDTPARPAAGGEETNASSAVHQKILDAYLRQEHGVEGRVSPDDFSAEDNAQVFSFFMGISR